MIIILSIFIHISLFFFDKQSSQILWWEFLNNRKNRVEINILRGKIFEAKPHRRIPRIPLSGIRRIFYFRFERIVSSKSSSERRKRNIGEETARILTPPLPTPPLCAFKVVDSRFERTAGRVAWEMWNDRRCETQQLDGNDEKKKKKEGKKSMESAAKAFEQAEESSVLGRMAFFWQFRESLDSLSSQVCHTHTEFLLSREFFSPRGNETCPVCSRRKYLLLVEAARSEANIFRNLSRKIFWEKIV